MEVRDKRVQDFLATNLAIDSRRDPISGEEEKGGVEFMCTWIATLPKGTLTEVFTHKHSEQKNKLADLVFGRLVHHSVLLEHLFCEGETANKPTRAAVTLPRCPGQFA